MLKLTVKDQPFDFYTSKPWRSSVSVDSSRMTTLLTCILLVALPFVLVLLVVDWLVE